MDKCSLSGSKYTNTSRISQDITGEASTLLQSSSTASSLGQGSNIITTSQMGVEKKYTNDTWYYMFLRNKEMKSYIDLFTGAKSVVAKSNPSDNEQEEKIERFFNFKVFPYTTANHKKRFEKISYGEDEYAKRKEAAIAIRQAFDTGSASTLNSLINKKEIVGDGFLFVCAPKKDLNFILANTYPRQYLATNYVTGKPSEIPSRQMEEFIYLYHTMPYNIELLEHPIEDYIKRKQKIRITGGVFKGKVGCIVRLHRNTHLAFAFGNMTVAVSSINAFPFEKID